MDDSFTPHAQGNVIATRTLAAPQQFLLWGLRIWVQGLKRRTDVGPTLREGFDLAGCPEGVAALDRWLGAAALTARRSLDVRCPRCPAISQDEALLINCVAAAQDGRMACVVRTLCHFLDGDGPATALAAVQDLADALDGAAMAVAVLPGEVIRPAAHRSEPGVDTGAEAPAGAEIGRGTTRATTRETTRGTTVGTPGATAVAWFGGAEVTPPYRYADPGLERVQ